MSLAHRLLPRFRPQREHRPLASAPTSGPALTVRWLGTAGHVVATDQTTLLIDPYLTRAGLRTLLSPLTPDEAAFARWLPARVDAVLLGHSHFDHLLDAPAIAKRYGARLVGSRSTLSFARASGVEEDALELVPPGGRTLTVGDFKITFVPSLHGRIALGRVPLPGEVREPPPLPAKFWHYRMGGAFGILLEARGRTVYHNGSADLIDAEVAGHHADVLLVGLAGRRATRRYLGRLVDALTPSLLVPTHHDSFFGPLELGERLLPGIDLRGFSAEARALAPHARVYTPLYRDELRVPLEGDARDATIVVD